MKKYPSLRFARVRFTVFKQLFITNVVIIILTIRFYLRLLPAESVGIYLLGNIRSFSMKLDPHRMKEEEYGKISSICDVAVMFAPEYDCNKIYGAWKVS